MLSHRAAPLPFAVIRNQVDLFSAVIKDENPHYFTFTRMQSTKYTFIRKLKQWNSEGNRSNRQTKNPISCCTYVESCLRLGTKTKRHELCGVKIKWKNVNKNIRSHSHKRRCRRRTIDTIYARWMMMTTMICHPYLCRKNVELILVLGSADVCGLCVNKLSAVNKQ